MRPRRHDRIPTLLHDLVVHNRHGSTETAADTATDGNGAEAELRCRGDQRCRGKKGALPTLRADRRQRHHLPGDVCGGLRLLTSAPATGPIHQPTWPPRRWPLTALAAVMGCFGAFHPSVQGQDFPEDFGHWIGRPSRCRLRRNATSRDPATDYRCLLYTSPSPRDATLSRMPSSA